MKRDLNNILKTCFNINHKESVVVITDEEKYRIAKKFYDAAKNVTKEVYLVVKPIGKYHGEEPGNVVAEALRNADVFIAVTKHSLTHTNARRMATKIYKRRGATLPDFTENMLPTLFSDYKEIRKLGYVLKKLFFKTNKIKVFSPSGTEIEFEIDKKIIGIDTGIYDKPGKFGNLPAGEIYLLPKKGTGNGEIVIDIMRHGKTVYAKKGTKIRIENGKAVEITDKKCLLAKIFRKVKNATNLAEFGIGLNRKAKIIGRILQDEKVYGTCHFAFGDNKSFGGNIECDVHLDSIITSPIIYADEKNIVKNNKILKI